MRDFGMILAGGTGSRFWPLSTADSPKQFHDVLGTGESLLQSTFSRIKRFLDADQIVVLTQERYRDSVLSQLSIRADRVLTEPERKNTAAAITYGMRCISQWEPHAKVFITPSDSLVCDVEIFAQRARQALAYADGQKLIALGVAPNRPQTGYGYIRFADFDGDLKKAIDFTEKPSSAKAQAFLVGGDYLWNTGIFAWSTQAFSTEMKKCAPALYQAFQVEGFAEHIHEIFDAVAEDSIDYALLEKSQAVFVLPVEFGWSDLGTWGSLYEKAEKDACGNALFGSNPVRIQARDNIIHTEKKKVVISGLENFIVVERADALLICPKGDEQRIKSWIKALR